MLVVDVKGKTNHGQIGEVRVVNSRSILARFGNRFLIDSESRINSESIAHSDRPDSRFDSRAILVLPPTHISST
jgi:hypothetical protein